MSFALFSLSVMSLADNCEARFPFRAPHSARQYFNAFDAFFVEAGNERNVDPALLKAIAYCETRLDPCAVSPVGAQGVMQFMPSTFSAVRAAASAQDPFEPRDAIRAAGLYVAALTNHWKGDLQAVVASYNAGPTAVARARKRGRRIPNIEETIGYVDCVTQTHAWLRRPQGNPWPEPAPTFPSLASLFGTFTR